MNTPTTAAMPDEVVQFYLQDSSHAGFHGARLKIVRCRRTERRGNRYQREITAMEAASRTANIAALENCGAIATSMANFARHIRPVLTMVIIAAMGLAIPILFISPNNFAIPVRLQVYPSISP